MRNLKRALSLALASMMLIGMMVVSAGAATKDFTDKDEIKHSEAVDTMVSLNVISGKEDGSYFDPTGTLTRAEMAKVISYVMNGGVEPNIGTKVNPTYSDIKGHWAEAYIEYCTSMGIINGDGAGKFNPNGTLTASQAAKMFLTAMGYNATVFGFTGNSWETNTNRYANEAGLYDELGAVAVSAPISRDDACQMAYNAIQAKMMERDWTLDPSTGKLTEGYRLGSNTLLTDRFGAKVFIGTYMGNDKSITSLNKGHIQVKGLLSTEDANNTTAHPANFPSTMGIENIGEEVKVIFKDGASGTKNQPDKNDTIYGVFNTGATTVVTGVKGDVKDNKSTNAQINIGGTKYDTKDTVTVITNYVGNGSALNAKGTSSANSALTTALKAATGDTIKAVTDPDDGKIQTIYVTESSLAVVTAINNEKVSMNNGVGTIKLADNDIYDGIAKGDVVVVTTLYAAKATDDDAYTTVKKAETVSGNVKSYKGKDTVKLDDTNYTIHGKTNMLTSGLEDAVASFTDSSIGESYTLYMINGYVGAAVQTSESANNYSLVTAVKTGGVAGGAFNALQLQVMNAEGTSTIITVSDDSAKTQASDYHVGDIVVYTGDASDAVVTIKGSLVSSEKAYSDSTKAFGGVVTSGDCVLFAEVSSTNVTANQPAISGAKYKAYKVRDLDGFDSNPHTAVVNSDNKVVAIFADLGSTPAGATSNTVYGIVTSYDGRVEVDDAKYYQWTVASNEETYTVYMSATDTLGTSAGKLISFDPTADNTYAANDITVVSTGGVYVKEYSEADRTLTFYKNVVASDGGFVGVAPQTLALDKDCSIVYVDADGDKAGSDIGINPFDPVTGYKNVAVKTKTVDNAEVIIAIFVETSNECDILGAGISGTTLSAADLKALDDGVYTPSVKEGFFETNAPASNVADLRVLKFTAAKAQNYTLVIKNAGTQVYSETMNSSTATVGAHFFYIDVGAQWSLNAGEEGTKPDAGTVCTFTITGADNTVALEGTVQF